MGESAFDPHQLGAKQPYLDYPRALAEGWPIATGVIEGACRHLVQDRMGITGARWSLEGAQAMLWLRAIAASGDTSATTPAATRTASDSPPDAHSRRAAPMGHPRRMIWYGWCQSDGARSRTARRPARGSKRTGNTAIARPRRPAAATRQPAAALAGARSSPG